MTAPAPPAGATANAADWDTEARAVEAQQPVLRARSLWLLAAVVLGLLLVWASVTEVDDIVRGQARVVPTQQVQVVQAVDGGVIADILVREGQVVDTAQVLMRLDPTRMAAGVAENAITRQTLRAKVARLQALVQGSAFQPPADLLRDAPELVAQERAIFASRLAELQAQTAVGRSQLAQRQQELRETQSLRETAERGIELLQKELFRTRPLQASGAVSEVEILRLERDLARLSGQRAQAMAHADRLRGAIAEAQQRLQETQLHARNQMGLELSDTLRRLAVLSAGSGTLDDRLTRTEIRSPARGTVLRLLAHTPGGVVQAGKPVLEILPLDDRLELQARLAPEDIGFVRPGMPAAVKYTAYDHAIYGGLQAEVVSISPDALSDRQGRPYYEVKLRTERADLGPGLPILPGMLAQVDLLVGKRSIASYLTRPLRQAKQNALSER